MNITSYDFNQNFLLKFYGYNSNFLNMNRMLNHVVLSLSNSKQVNLLPLELLIES